MSLTNQHIEYDREYIGREPIYREGTQKQRLLALLRSRSFVPLPNILALGIADYYRVMDFLKEDGFLIDCHCTRSGQQKNVVYVFRGYDERKKRVKRSWYGEIWHRITGK